MKLLLPTEFTSELEPKLAHIDPDLQLVWADTHGEFKGDPSDAEVYLNWFYLKPDLLHRVLSVAPNLRWHQPLSAGVNHILTPTYLQREITLTNGAGTFAIPIAETLKRRDVLLGLTGLSLPLIVASCANNPSNPTADSPSAAPAATTAASGSPVRFGYQKSTIVLKSKGDIDKRQKAEGVEVEWKEFPAGSPC